MPALIKRCLCGGPSARDVEAATASHIVNSQSQATDTGDEEGAAGDVVADFSLGKHTMRTMTGRKVLAQSGRPEDLLAV